MSSFIISVFSVKISFFKRHGIYYRLEDQELQYPLTFSHSYIYIYIYIYVCVCVCVCVSGYC